jgi:ankyrin repeat protein
MSFSNKELVDAARDGKLVDIKRLVQDGADVNFQDAIHSTALLWVNRRGHTKLCAFWL